MAHGEAFETLCKHDRWATQQLLAACRPLTDAQLDQPFEMGVGSLRATVHHIIDAMQAWSTRVHGTAATPTPCDGAGITDLAERHTRVCDSFANAISLGPIDAPIAVPRYGTMMHTTRGMIATHVLTHGTHHRAQALNMLRHLGATPLPKSSVMEWSIATGVTQLESAQ